MHTRLLATAVASLAVAAIYQQQRLNPVIDLVAAKQATFGLYAPAAPRAGRGAAGGAAGSGAAAAPAPPTKTPAELGADAIGFKRADYIFDGTMESPASFDRAYGNFSQFVAGTKAAGAIQNRRMTHPLFVKTPAIAPDTVVAAERIARQLNLGVTGIVFVDVENARELEQGIRMMRFRSNGGIRPDDVGGAPAYWGMSDGEYRTKADVWPLNPRGELINFAIIESREGIANAHAIAAVKGLGVLFPGAGTLRGVYSTRDSTGRAVRDSVAWEGAIQTVLSACKAHNVPCGYPASESDIELRMKQGFSVFIVGWGEPGFRAVDLGRRSAGRR